MLQKLPIIFCIVFLILCPFTEIQALDNWTGPKEDFIGTWKGGGKIIVAWRCHEMTKLKRQIK